MTINEEQHAALAVQVIKLLGQLPNPEKQAVLKTAATLLEHSLTAEITTQTLMNHFKK
ncbi:hypothetical protein Q4489_04235 [Thalassotalea sp. 1_MG-2023]|uniref:hypothetical protein n=1 Tax=Thalassotalea sp. 1_MG-2023 TaxID=3062680 RepID=UPI0026E36D09|nr:hypothetical protein [Thalassotalea sp. 1_MG-2023]MDO6426205.1 hypothetical protein [Thalassotalea sp. 1_MG-2023]